MYLVVALAVDVLPHKPKCTNTVAGAVGAKARKCTSTIASGVLPTVSLSLSSVCELIGPRACAVSLRRGFEGVVGGIATE